MQPPGPAVGLPIQPHQHPGFRMTRVLSQGTPATGARQQGFPASHSPMCFSLKHENPTAERTFPEPGVLQDALHVQALHGVHVHHALQQVQAVGAQPGRPGEPGAHDAGEHDLQLLRLGQLGIRWLLERVPPCASREALEWAWRGQPGSPTRGLVPSSGVVRARVICVAGPGLRGAGALSRLAERQGRAALLHQGEGPQLPPVRERRLQHVTRGEPCAPAASRQHGKWGGLMPYL